MSADVYGLAAEYDKWVVRERELRHRLEDEPENDALEWAHSKAKRRLESARRAMKEATE